MFGKEKNSNQKKAEESRNLFLQCTNTAWRRWRGNIQTADDFFLNEQLTREERDDLKNAGMPDFTVNKITPSVEILKYFLTANNPKWHVIGREGSDVDLAEAHNAMVERCWELSDGRAVFGQVIQDSLVKGLGYFVIYIDPNADGGMGEVKFRFERPEDIYVDPSSRHIRFRDANFILIKKDLTKGHLIKDFPEYKDKILKADGNDEHLMSYSNKDSSEAGNIQPHDITELFTSVEENKYIDYYERHILESVEMVKMTIKSEPTQEQMQLINVRIKEDVETFKMKASDEVKNILIELQDKFERGIITERRLRFDSEMIQKEFEKSIEEYRNELITKAINEATYTETKIVSKDEYEKFKKSKIFKDKIVEAINFWKNRLRIIYSVGNDTFLGESILPVSEYTIVPVVFIHTGTPYPIGAVQLAVGTQREINKAHQLMIHSASVSANPRYLYEEGTIDVNHWEKYSSAPNALLPFHGEKPPTAIQPQPINNAFYTVAEKGEQIIADLFGSRPQLSGGKSDQETYRGLLAMDEFATRRVRSWMANVVEPALENLGKIFTELSQYIYTAEKVFRIVQPETGDMREYKLNVPIYADFGKVIKKYNDYQSVQFDIKIVSGGTLPANRWAKLEEYTKWLQLGVLDDIAFVAETDIKNKEQLLERNSRYAQMQNKIAELEEIVKSQKGSIETFQRELERANIKDKVNTAQAEIVRAVADFKANLKSEEESRELKNKEFINKAISEMEILKGKQNAKESRKPKG